MKKARNLREAKSPPKRDQAAPRIVPLQHALKVLRMFPAEESRLRADEIARRLGMHESSVARVLGALEQERLLERDAASGAFRLGAGLVALAGPLLTGIDLREAARPYLEKLARASGETASLSLWTGSEALNTEQVLGPAGAKQFSTPGRLNPAHCTAAGPTPPRRAAPGVFPVSAPPPAEIERILSSPLERFTDDTIVDRDRLMTAIKTVQRDGYAINDGEFMPEIAAIASAVRDWRNEVVAAVVVTLPRGRFTPERRDELIRGVRDSARDISRRLGFAE